MDRLTTEQAGTIRGALGPATGYLWRLLERMDRTNLRLRDPRLYELVTAARDAMHALGVELHYENCGHGVGWPLAPSGGAGGPEGGWQGGPAGRRSGVP